MNQAKDNMKNLISLTDAEDERNCVIQELKGEALFCHWLREQGFCELAVIKKTSSGNNFICEVCGTRYCLNREVSDKIYVKQ